MGKQTTKPNDHGESWIPQIFSFRSKDRQNNKEHSAEISIIPSQQGMNSVDKNFFEDIGVKLQVSKFIDEYNEDNLLHGNDNSKGNINLREILNNIPSIQIREYTQDTRVDFILSIAKFFIEGVKDGAKAGESLTADELKNIAHLMVHDLKKSDSSFYASIKDKLKNYVPTGGLYKDVQDKQILIDFAYMLYYRLLDTTTTNNYILPFNSQELLKGNGNVGWDDNSFGGGTLGHLGFLGDFLSKGINLTVTPIWYGMKGSEGYTLDFTVNLFNDSIDSAVNNYIFINTIIPQNLPTHYCIFQQPPSVYDLKIEGFNRLFMCSGKFDCNYKGVLRSPSSTFIKKLKTYVNTEVLPETYVDTMIKKNQIKIPDIYELHLTFKSLLPNTFNNFIFQYALNEDVINMSYDKGKSIQNGFESGGIKDAIKFWGEKREGDGKAMTGELNSIDKVPSWYKAAKEEDSGDTQVNESAWKYEDKKKRIFEHYENLRYRYEYKNNRP